jgi:hypothetical protein
MSDLLNQQIKLKDGRKLGYAECGNLKGKPVFYFHGTPGSRFVCNILTEAANSVGTLDYFFLLSVLGSNTSYRW